MRKLVKLLLVSLLITFLCSCEKNINKENLSDIKELTSNETEILGTWYYYSHSFSEYRCITFNNDRTACYYEIPSLSLSITKSNIKYYTDWYADTNKIEESVFHVYIKGDYTGRRFWAGYTINTSDWVLRKMVTQQ